MAELPFLLMTTMQAAQLRNETAEDADRLDPREVTVGPHSGKFALNAAVLTDPAYTARRDAFLMLGNPVVLDTDVAFYVEPTPEDLARKAAEEAED